MPTLTRSAFLAEMNGKTLSTAGADARLGALDLSKADLDGDGQVRGALEMSRLFGELDRFDSNGQLGSIATTTASGTATSAGLKLAAIRALASTPSTSPASAPKDAALRSAFPEGLATGTVGAGSGAAKLSAIQYALGRLGHYRALVDGAWGDGTRGGIDAFRATLGLGPSGTLDAAGFAKLDLAVSAIDPKVPAARAASPLQYLSDFTARGVSKITIHDPARPIGWSHPEIRAAYGRFVAEYWPALKENRCEADCKTLALFFMDQFRKKLLADTQIALPRPKSSRGGVPASTWIAATAANPHGFFQRTASLPKVRPGYAASQNIERMDPKHSMLYGINLRYAGIDADGVSRATTIVAPWHPSRSNGGDKTKPEIPIDVLAPGDLVFIDHKGDGKYDHTVNVVGVERDPEGRVRKLTLAVGSFDDMADADGATPPAGLFSVNNYCEEVVVRFAENGRITGSEVTWQSEPSYVAKPRYGAHNTLMEANPSGTLFVGRWA